MRKDTSVCVYIGIFDGLYIIFDTIYDNGIIKCDVLNDTLGNI